MTYNRYDRESGGDGIEFTRSDLERLEKIADQGSPLFKKVFDYNAHLDKDLPLRGNPNYHVRKASTHPDFVDLANITDGSPSAIQARAVEREKRFKAMSAYHNPDARRKQ